MWIILTTTECETVTTSWHVGVIVRALIEPTFLINVNNRRKWQMGVSTKGFNSSYYFLFCGSVWWITLTSVWKVFSNDCEKDDDWYTD